MTVSTAAGARIAIGPIDAQTQDWWATVRRESAGQDAISVVLDPPESYAVSVPGLPRSRREIRRLVDRLAPIRREYLTLAPPHDADGGDITITIAHTDRLRTLRDLFASNSAPLPVFRSSDGVAFEGEDKRPDRATRTTAVVVLASLLAIPVLCSVGATLLSDRIDRETGTIERSQQGEDDARRVFRDLTRGPTVAARIALVARHLPDEGTISAIGGGDGRRLSITVDRTTPDSLKLALTRAGTFSALREDSRERTSDGYRLTYSGMPK